MTGAMNSPMTRSGILNRCLRLAAAGGLLALLALTNGCTSAVRAYQRERLTDRIMSFQADAKGTARRMKTFESREGSTGGSSGAGGGCACN
jgi:hypothetical protein